MTCLAEVIGWANDLSRGAAIEVGCAKGRVRADVRVEVVRADTVVRIGRGRRRPGPLTLRLTARPDPAGGLGGGAIEAARANSPSLLTYLWGGLSALTRRCGPVGAAAAGSIDVAVDGSTGSGGGLGGTAIEIEHVCELDRVRLAYSGDPAPAPAATPPLVRRARCVTMRRTWAGPKAPREPVANDTKLGRAREALALRRS